MKNLILISIDNLRYDCIGYQPDKRELEKYGVLKYLETPTLDSIAEKSLCFTQCISTNTYTTAAHASVLTGLYPPKHGVREFYGKKLSSDVYTLAETLKVFGYETVMMTDVPHLFEPPELTRGFNHIFRNDDKGLLSFIKENRDKKIFLFVHFFDVHEPFLLSKYLLYDNNDFYKSLRSLYRQYNSEMPSDRNPWNNWMNLFREYGKKIETLFPLYVRGVTKFDKNRFKDFIKELKRINILDDSILFIFSDHGEGRSKEDDPDFFAHAGALYDNVLRVPLIVHSKDLGHKISDNVVSLIDIVPTIFNVVLQKNAHDVLPYEVDGMSLFDDDIDERLVYSETWKANSSFPGKKTFISFLIWQRSIRTRDRKFLLYGEPEVLLKENINSMSNEEFLTKIYRGLLYRFEEYEEYVKGLKILKSNEMSQNELLDYILRSEEYISKNRCVSYDLKKDPFENHPLNIQEKFISENRYSVYREKIIELNNNKAVSLPIFKEPSRVNLREIVKRIYFAEFEDNIESIISNEHIFETFIYSCLEKYKGLSDKDFVIKTYKIYFNRDPDEEELSRHLEFLENGGLREIFFENSIISSKEFTSLLQIDSQTLKEGSSGMIPSHLLKKMTELEYAKKRLDEIVHTPAWQLMDRMLKIIDNKLFPVGTLRGKLWWRFVYMVKRRLNQQPKKKAVIEEDLRQKKGSAVIPSQLYFSVNENPEVSVIIPFFNNWVYTFNCLNSIRENTFDVSYEVIIVDDGSTDETKNLLDKIAGVKTIHNKENIGFVDSCNIGASHCNGQYLLFLNNDTLVTKGWLKSLIETFKNDKKVGVAGGKQIYPDGTLQEAGIIIWEDGSGSAYGRLYDPDSPEYNYTREVDAVPGSCLMIKGDIFNSLGGFDRRFSPAYWEDIDLCFSVRSLGYKVVYQPKAEVIHFGGVTGENTLETKRDFSSDNRSRFKEKWAQTLKNKYPKDLKSFFIARDYYKKGKMLLVLNKVPERDKHSGDLRMFNIINILVELGHKVTLFVDNLERISPYTEELQQLGVEVLYGNINTKDYIKTYGKYFDLIILSRPVIGYSYLNLLKKYTRKRKLIYDTVDLHYIRFFGQYEVKESEETLKEAHRYKKMEILLTKKCDITLTVSEIEKDTLLKEVPGAHIEVVPNIHQVYPTDMPFESRGNIIFIGGFLHSPNKDAIIYFVNEIFPLIKKKIQGVKFYIVGSNPPQEIISMQCENVEVTGYVPDVAHFFEKCRLMVCPLRYGAGIKGKITQSMSYGLPFVTTSIGAEGMQIVNNYHCLISDDPQEFADFVVNLYHDKALWEKLRKNSIDFIRENYDYDIIKDKIYNIIEPLIQKK